MLQGKKILLGVCGSIAAYKAALLVRLLKKKGADVRVIMTASAFDFVGAVTLATLAEHPVEHQMIKDDRGEWVNHVKLGLWADLFVIAPLSANTLSKLASGACDNLLTAVYLSARCPVMVAPAMDLDMYAHPATQANLMKIRSYGNMVIDAVDGPLASGLSGKGRMAEPEQLLEHIQAFFAPGSKAIFSGKRILITGGPTLERIDPVRFISNHSTGKMALALVQAALQQGAEVVLVHGPLSQAIPAHPKLKSIAVESAAEMFEACKSEFPTCQLGILAAAVADYTPQKKETQKIKKSAEHFELAMTRTPDIAAHLGQMKSASQLLIGFALETENELENARGKMQRKNLDMIVLNSLQDAGAGFGYDTNRISIITPRHILPLDLMSKADAAQRIMEEIAAIHTR